MKISLIAARSKNGVIGSNNNLPWRMPADMQFFKQATSGHHLLVGRKTYESFNQQLKNRIALVLTSKANYQPKYEDDLRIASIEEGIEVALKNGETELFVIGGGEIYHQVLQKDLATHIYLTEIDAIVHGDTFFPDFDETKWTTIREDAFAADDKNQYNYTFKLYQKKAIASRISG